MLKGASKHFFKSLFLVIVAVAGFYVYGPQNNKTVARVAATDATDTAHVVHVVDGDTIDVQIGDFISRVRLLGIDTPETVDPRKPVQCFGQEASAKAKEWLTDAAVQLKSDPSQGDRDKYGRLLRYVYRGDGLFVNEELIKQGFAHEYTYDLPYQYQMDFKTDEIAARTQKLGLWADGACDSSKAQ